MAIITQEITVEVAKPNYFAALIAKQGDIDSRFLKVTFAHDGKKIEIKPTSTAMIGGERPDGQSKSFAGKVNNDGTATVPLTAWMLELPGVHAASPAVVTMNTDAGFAVKRAVCSTDAITVYWDEPVLTGKSCYLSVVYGI